MSAPRPVRREIALDALPPAVWAAAVEAAADAFGRSGATRETPEGPRWTAVPVRGRAEVTLRAETTAEGATLVGEVVGPARRPVVLAAALLCLPIAALAALVLASRPTPLEEWAVVGALVAVPVVVALGTGLVGWARRVRARRRLRAVMAAAAHASRVAVPDRERVLPPDPEPEADIDALPTPAAAVWLTDDEIAQLAARDARIPRAHAVAAATALRSGPRAAEWL